MSIRKLLGRSQRREDVLQLLKQDAINEASNQGKEYQGIRRKREVLDGDSLEKAREELRELKQAKRNMRYAGRRANVAIERAKGPRSRGTYMYEAGELITVKRDVWQGPKKGDVGIILETDPSGNDYLLQFENNRMLWVQNGEKIEQWDAKWVEWLDGDEDDMEMEDEVCEEQNFEILESDTNIHTEEENFAEAFVSNLPEPEGQPEAIEFTMVQAGDFVMYTGAGRNLYNDITLLEPIGAVKTSDALMVMEVHEANPEEVILEVLAGDTHGFVILNPVEVEVL